MKPSNDSRPARRGNSARSPSAKKSATLRERLTGVSRNLWWTWSSDATALWSEVAQVFPARRRADLAKNPVVLVEKLTDAQVSKLDANAAFKKQLVRVERAQRRATRSLPAPHGLSKKAPVAYFSMEFGLHETLPVYAGGLGILAGDHIKSASDTAVPLVGVTFLYRSGYFRQHLDRSGRQDVIYPRADFSTMPVEVVRDAKGHEIRVRVELPGRTVALRAWRLAVGRRDLYLLDSDVGENSSKDRKITDRLYIGDREARITQEVVLGIGGVRLLRALEIDPGVWHLNEGHVVFLSVERVRELREKAGLSVGEAYEAISADTVFTTHTPVPEGNEAFDLPLAERFLRPHCEAAGIPVEDYLALGRDEDRDGRPFLSLTVLAMRLSRLRNGVSALHGDVSRSMWSKLWPGFAAESSPVTSVTNGIHVGTWVAPQFDRIYRDHLGEDWCERVADPATWKSASKISDRQLWEAKRELRGELVEFVRDRTRQRLERCGYSKARIEKETTDLLDPEALTIGFARRFALYKRAGLLFKDIERVAKLFGSKSRPVQIIFAGKPHPEDPLGAKLFEKVGALARNSKLKGRVVLLENYDTEVARYMVRGVDVWLNNPRRPQEASGTSGQKVPVNCGINLSILDGWWCEGYDEDVGWAFGKAKDYTDDALQDRDDHADLLRVLSRQVIPLFYERSKGRPPRNWLKMVKQGLKVLVPRFSTHHMVLEYAERLYASAYANGVAVRRKGYALARELAAWRKRAESCWPLAHVRRVERSIPSKRAPGFVEVDAYLGGLVASEVAFFDENGHVLEIQRSRKLADGTHTFRLALPESGRKVLLSPSHASLVHPQEFGESIDFMV